MYRWKPSKSAKAEFAKKMKDVEEFCEKNNIHQSLSSDSYYFSVNGQNYRVSNHTVESSNAHAYSELTGEQIRDKYHDDSRDPDVVYIHAGKTRIIDIYNDIVAGYKLDGRGNRI